MAVFVLLLSFSITYMDSHGPLNPWISHPSLAPPIHSFTSVEYLLADICIYLYIMLVHEYTFLDCTFGGKPPANKVGSKLPLNMKSRAHNLNFG